MSQIAHRIYIGTMVGIVLLVTLLLFYKGISYYSTSLEERFYHPDHDHFKASGIYGHGMGILGTILVLIGVVGYIAKKRYGFWARFGRLKYWLEFHIFLCTLGPILILFHTAFKFGGIASVSFWAMVAVVVSGVIGRFIYIQIPRTIEGRALSLNEVKDLRNNVTEVLRQSYDFDQATYAAVVDLAGSEDRNDDRPLFKRMVSKFFEDRQAIRRIRKTLRRKGVSRKVVREVTTFVKREQSLANRIDRLQTMQNLFKYWHVAHLPFAIIMLVFLVLHVGVTLAFGYKWIF